MDYEPEEGGSPLFYLIMLECFVFAHMTISIQVAHVSQSKYSPFYSRLMLLQLITFFFVWFFHLFLDI